MIYAEDAPIWRQEFYRPDKKSIFMSAVSVGAPTREEEIIGGVI